MAMVAMVGMVGMVVAGCTEKSRAVFGPGMAYTDHQRDYLVSYDLILTIISSTGSRISSVMLSSTRWAFAMGPFLFLLAE